MVIIMPPAWGPMRSMQRRESQSSGLVVENAVRKGNVVDVEKKKKNDVVQKRRRWKISQAGRFRVSLPLMPCVAREALVLFLSER
jgi:hypothetical protein